MRSLAALLLISSLLACSGAGQGDASAPPDSSGERPTGVPAPVEPADRLPRLLAGADLVLAPEARGSWGHRRLAHAPRHFLAKGWADARTLWGLSGSSSVLVRADEPEYSVWSRDAWDASLSPDGAALAWINGRGVWVGVRSGEPRLLVERDRVSGVEGDLSGPLLWSPGGERLLVKWAGEAGATFATVEVPSGEVSHLARRGEGYLLVEAFGWLDPERILFTAQPHLATDGGRVEWSGLAVYDRAENAPELVAGGAGGESIRPLALWGEHGLLIGARSGGSGGSERILLYDTRAWSARPVTLPPGSRILAHDTTRAVVVEDFGEAEGEREHGLHLWSSATGASVPLARVRGNDLRIAWSPLGDRLLVSRSVRVPEPGSDSFREETRTHLLERVPPR